MDKINIIVFVFVFRDNLNYDFFVKLKFYFLDNIYINI